MSEEIADMLAIIADNNATTQEIQAAGLTIAEALSTPPAEPTICAKCNYFIDEKTIGQIEFPATCVKSKVTPIKCTDYVHGLKEFSVCCEDINHGNCPHFEDER